MRVVTGQGDVFGTASSAVQTHGTAPSSMVVTTGRQGAPASFMENFDGHFGALNAAATGSNTVIKQLAAMTTTQYDKISAGIVELKLALPTTTTPTTRGTGSPLTSNEHGKLNRHINQIEADIKGNWVTGGFCSYYGHGVCEGHGIRH